MVFFLDRLCIFTETVLRCAVVPGSFFDLTGLVVVHHSRRFCIGHERTVAVAVGCCNCHKIALFIDRASLAVRMHNIFIRKQTVYSPFQGTVTVFLGVGIELLRLCIVKVQVTFIEVNLTFRTMVVNAPCVSFAVAVVTMGPVIFRSKFHCKIIGLCIGKCFFKYRLKICRTVRTAVSIAVIIVIGCEADAVLCGKATEVQNGSEEGFLFRCFVFCTLFSRRLCFRRCESFFFHSNGCFAAYRCFCLFFFFGFFAFCLCFCFCSFSSFRLGFCRYDLFCFC